MHAGEVVDDRFELRRLLGQGGMGQVFEARDRTREWGDRVAIKTVQPQLAADPAAADELEREVRLSQRLRHAHVVEVHAYRRAGRWPYIVMQFLDGQPLSHHLYAQPGHRVTEQRFLEMAQQILAAVAYAHEVGVVHRDLKPGNVMVGPEQWLTLMDFGIAATLKATYTRVTGGSYGVTPQYAAPEQINGEDPAPSMDIYALGCMFYELLAGHPPFYQGNIIHQQLTKTPAPLAALPPALNEAVLGCLEKDAKQRWQSVAEIQAALAGTRTVRLPRGAAAAATGRVVEPSPPSPPTVGYGRLAPWLLFGGAAAMVLALSLSLLPRQHAPQVHSLSASPGPVKSPPGPVEPALGRPMPTYTPPASVQGPRLGVRQSVVQVPASTGLLSSETEAALAAARRAMEGGDYAAAERSYREALNLSSDNAEARAGIGRAKRARQAELLVLAGAPTPSEPFGSRQSLDEARRDPGNPGAEAGLARALMAKEAEERKEPPPPASMAPKPSPELTGVLQIVVRPWAEVTVDGVSAGTTPFRPLTLGVGVHTVVFSHPDYKTVQRPVTIRPGDVSRLELDLAWEAFRRK